MTKTKYEKELEKKSRGDLVHRCAFSALDYTGSKEELIARLVEAEQAEPEQAEETEVEPEPETPAPEPPESEGEEK